MPTSRSRWRRIIALIIMAVLLMTVIQPIHVSAARDIALLPIKSSVLSAHAQDPVNYDTSIPLRNMSIKTMAPANDLGNMPSDVNGPYKELTSNFQIPQTKLWKGQISPAAPAVSPNFSASDMRVYDTPMPGLDASWDGLNQGSNRTIYGFGVLPPDTNGAVGPNNYIQLVNNTIGIWDFSILNGVGLPKLVYGPAPISAIFTGLGDGICDTYDDGDPVAVYDSIANRFVVTQFALPNFPNGPFYECIAVSATSDPMGAWHRYSYSFDVINDYPKFGVWPDGYYMTFNQFSSGSFNWAGQGVAVLERDLMLTGGAARIIYIDTAAACTLGTEPECFLGGMLPSDLDGLIQPPTGALNIFMQFDDDAWGYSPDQLQLWEFAVNWAGAGTGTFSHVVDLPVNAFDSEVCPLYARSCIAQPGTAQGLDAISDRLMYRIQYRNFGGYETMVVNHTVDVSGTDAQHAGIRWYELHDSGTGWGVYQQGDFAPDTADRWMGSIAMDRDGNISLGYSVADETTGLFPSIRYAGRLLSNPLNTLPLTEVTIVTGGGSQTSSAARWGDYSLMDVAPDGCTFWYTNEYLRGTTPAEWYTKIASFHQPTCEPYSILFMPLITR